MNKSQSMIAVRKMTAGRRLVGLGIVFFLSGCNLTSPLDAFNKPINNADETPTPAVVVNTLSGQNDEMAFFQCRDEVVAMDRMAVVNASLAQYLASANAVAGCLDLVSSNQSFITQQQRMQLQALAVLNYLRGGDVAQSRLGLVSFKQTFQGRDLYFADNSSFIDTFELLLNDPGLGATQVQLNVNKTLLAEFQRKQYWSTH